MFNVNKKSATYINLDFVRGVAALLVMFSHARAYVLVLAPQLDNPGLVAKGFYFVTGFGHQAVMIFFVLSGFFISRSIVNMLERKQWTWRRYLVNRMSRLWVVLIPALLLTAFWDHLGIYLGATDFYSGIDTARYGSIPGTKQGGADLTLSTFIENVLFLVGVTEPNVYGTNGPLWSLTYEFWYYMVFPLAFLVFLPVTGPVAKMVQIALVVFCLWLLPFRLLWMGIIWLYGYGVLVLNRSEAVRAVTCRWTYFAVTFLMFAASMVATRADLISDRMVGDLILGFCFALFMMALVSHDVPSELFAAVSKFISKISYSLYLVHFSLLGFIAAVFLDTEQQQFGVAGVGLFTALCLLCVLYATIVHWFFERNTYHVITFMRRVFRC